MIMVWGEGEENVIVLEQDTIEIRYSTCDKHLLLQGRLVGGAQGKADQNKRPDRPRPHGNPGETAK